MPPPRKNTKTEKEILNLVEMLWKDVKANRDAMHGTILVMRDTLDLRARLDAPPERVAAVGISWDEVLGVLNVELAMEASAYASSFKKADQMTMAPDEAEEPTEIELYAVPVPDVEA